MTRSYFKVQCNESKSASNEVSIFQISQDFNIAVNLKNSMKHFFARLFAFFQRSMNEWVLFTAVEIFTRRQEKCHIVHVLSVLKTIILRIPDFYAVNVNL